MATFIAFTWLCVHCCKRLPCMWCVFQSDSSVISWSFMLQCRLTSFIAHCKWTGICLRWCFSPRTAVFIGCSSYLYQIAHLGDDDDEPEFSSAMPLEEGDTFFFAPRPLRNLVLVDELDSLSPILACQVADLGKYNFQIKCWSSVTVNDKWWIRVHDDLPLVCVYESARDYS